jgi:hypothetical protein
MRAVVRLREHRKEEKIQIQKPEICALPQRSPKLLRLFFYFPDASGASTGHKHARLEWPWEMMAGVAV